MPSPLKCDFCTKSATVHLTQIVNNKVHKVEIFVKSVPKRRVLQIRTGFRWPIPTKASLNSEPVLASGVRCEQCGFTQADFKKHGRFGCPQCYQTFSGVIEPMLGSMHKGTAHTGKVPLRALNRRSLSERLSKLEGELDEAIKAERYEDAARFRDEILQVKQAFDPKPAGGR